MFEQLDAFVKERRKFDIVILDPPAFTGTHASISAAERGYKEINLRALQLLKKGGMLVSCSCSGAVTENIFKEIIRDSAADAGRRLLLQDFRTQSRDHPVLVGYNESHYLKCGFYRAV